MGDFSKYSNYRDNAGVSGVVYPAHSGVLEVELNEMQEINKNMLRDMIHTICGDGITDLSKLVYEGGAVKVKDGCAIAVDGILVNCNGLSVTTTNATIYLQVWEETVDYTAQLKKNGNQQSGETVSNWFKDSRAENETTRRKVVKYTLATSSDTSNGKKSLAIAKVTNSVMTKLIGEINLSKLTAAVNDLTSYVGYTDSDIYGVEADWKNNKFTRLAASVNMTGGTDHDGILPWTRRRCNVADDGTVTAYFGDEGYVESGKLTSEVAGKPSGTRVQVMVEQNKFYYRMIPLEIEPITDGIGFKVRKARYYISATPKVGFKVHPAFVHDGKEYDKIYIGAFKASLYDDSATIYVLDDSVAMDTGADKLASIAGAKPASGLSNVLTRSACRTLAGNIGQGWQIMDFTIASMNQLLFLIEYAKMDAQSVIGKGRCDISDDESTSMTINTGGTSSLGNTSGMADGTNGQVSVSYRGQEDPFGNIWEFIDGINIEANNKNIAYFADANYADDKGTSPYQSTGFTIAMANGYISAFGWSEACDWAFLPAESLGDSGKPVGDYVWVNPSYSGWLIARLGGGWNGSLSCGLCCWYLGNASSIRYRYVGSRLVYLPVAS